MVEFICSSVKVNMDMNISAHANLCRYNCMPENINATMCLEICVEHGPR